MVGTSRRAKTALSALIGGGLVLGLIGCGSSGSASSTGEGLTPVSVRTDVYFTGAVLPLLAGVEKGIFEKHGLDVEINPGTGSATTIQTVGNGSDDIGYADAGALVQSVAQGIPVKMVAGMVQESPLALFSFEDSGISAPKDLEGKVAGYTPGSAAERLFPAYATAAGIDEDSMTFRNVDVPTRDSLFMTRKTDFTFGLLNTSLPNIEARCQCNPTVFPYSEQGVQALSSGIITGNDFAQKNPDTLKAFLAALQEAVDFANDNPDAAVDAFFAQATDSKLKKEVVKGQWEASMSLHETEANKGEPFGCTVREDWEETIQMMEKYGEMEEGAVTPGSAASNDFLPEPCRDVLEEAA